MLHSDPRVGDGLIPSFRENAVVRTQPNGWVTAAKITVLLRFEY